MDKENSRSAAGLRRSAIAERIRLKEEWLELKGITDKPLAPSNRLKQPNTLVKKTQYVTKRQNAFIPPSMRKNVGKSKNKTMVHKPMSVASEVLRGVVALVEVGAESRALALRAALTALGASVVPAWTPIVTHLVWAQGGCRATRAKARALASRLVSPLWVEACAASNKRLPEQAFPAAARASDLPSPRTLRQLLKKAEMENISLFDVSEDKDENAGKAPRLRISSETEHDSSANSSANTSANTTNDTSRDTTTDVESRVNTAPRRALPISMSPACPAPAPAKSRRKLFTHKEAEDTRTKPTDEESETDTTIGKRVRVARPTPRDRRELARAERIARRLVAACEPRPAPARDLAPRIVLTGMGRAERTAVIEAIHLLNGKIQSHVTRKTTHVLLGSCKEDNDNHCSGIRKSPRNKNISGNVISDISNKPNNCSSIRRSPRNKSDTGDNQNHCSGISTKSPKNKSFAGTAISDINKTIAEIHSSGISALKNSNRVNNNNAFNISGVSNINNNEVRVVHRSEVLKARTLNSLLGAARGCRVLYGQWALDCAEAKRWIHHHGYEVPHLKKICQKARIERTALGQMHSEYAYDVFNGMRVRVSADADQRVPSLQLLKLCGAIVQDGGQDGGGTQNGGCDLTVGSGDNEVSSKWVFDSVAAARMRTTRRYVNNPIANSLITQTQSTNR